jgi:hypothetical protein
LIPIEAVRIEVRKLAIIVDQLIALGRSRGMFSTTEALDRGHAEATALVRSEAGRRDASHSGLYVTRDGQVSGWVALPRDYLGSVLDPDDIRARLQALLETLVAVDVPRSGKVAIACGIEPADTLTSGRASDVGHRVAGDFAIDGSWSSTPPPRRCARCRAAFAVRFNCRGDRSSTRRSVYCRC